MNRLHPIKFKALVEYIGKMEGIKPDQDGLYDLRSVSQETMDQRFREFATNQQPLDFNPEAN